MTKHEALQQAITKAGGQAALARAIGKPVTQQHVWHWLHRLKELPAQHVLAVEAATGVSKHQLRPDVFGAISEKALAQSAAAAG